MQPTEEAVHYRYRRNGCFFVYRLERDAKTRQGDDGDG